MLIWLQCGVKQQLVSYQKNRNLALSLSDCQLFLENAHLGSLTERETMTFKMTFNDTKYICMLT